jgi:hypothetical protein
MSSPGLRRDGDDAEGWPVLVPQRRGFGRVRDFSETPCGRPRMKWRDGLVCSRGLLEAQQGESWPVRRFTDFSLRLGRLMFDLRGRVDFAP